MKNEWRHERVCFSTDGFKALQIVVSLTPYPWPGIVIHYFN
ncbi:hypothetical protein ACJA3J_13750 [Halobacillus sp. SY10]|nr:hypothetical protein [Halobacillus aidingensis]